MAQLGDRVQVPSKKVGQQPREGVVTGVSGTLLRVTWSTGEESTITPSSGSLVVIGRVRMGSKSVGAGRGGTKVVGTKKVGAKKTAKAAAKKPTKSSTTKGSKAVKSSAKASAGRAKRRK